MARQGDEVRGRGLGQTYVIDRRLGRDMLRPVYAARHGSTGERVAIRIFSLGEDVMEASAFRRFQDEALAVSALGHPHIARVFYFDEGLDEQPFMVMELLEGEDLGQRLRRVGRLPVAQALALARQVGGALQAAHQAGVIHRDVKPQSIFLCRQRLANRASGDGEVEDPIGPPSGDRHMVRGGSFAYPPWVLRSAVRHKALPGLRGLYTGFRCVRATWRHPAAKRGPDPRNP